MIILAIETSCDETAISVLKTSGGRRRPEFKILSNIVSSQVKVHAPFWGVVPNLAKREHQKNLPLVLIKALKEGRFPISNFQFPISKHSELKVQQIEKILEREPELLEQFKKSILSLKPPKIDIIAVTHGPGLEPALWVGVNFAKALGFFWKKPIIGINHLVGRSQFCQSPGFFLEKADNRNQPFGRTRACQLACAGWQKIPISNFQFPKSISRTLSYRKRGTYAVGFNEGLRQV